jgi:hypothetical protein
MDGPAVESGFVGRVLRTRPDLTWGPHSLVYNVCRIVIGVKSPGQGADHPQPISAAEVKEG